MGDRWSYEDDIDPLFLTRTFPMGDRTAITAFVDDAVGGIQWCISDDPLAECDTLTGPKSVEELSPYAPSTVDEHFWAPKPDGSELTMIWFDSTVPGLFQLSLDDQGAVQDKGAAPL